MILNFQKLLSCILGSVLLLTGPSCSGGEKGVDDPGGPENPGGGYEDIQVVDGKVRFYLTESEKAARRSMGVGDRVWKKSAVQVNGKSYPVVTDDSGRCYIEVAASGSGAYNAVLTASGSPDWYGSSAYTEVKLPYSQFWEATAASLQSYPMYGSYTKENGNKMVFEDAFAVLDLALTGSAKISSVKVSGSATDVLAGFANFLPSQGGFKMTGGVGFAVLNCTDGGDCVPLSSSTPKHFYIMLAPGDYASGLKITVSDSEHRSMEHTLSPARLEAGRATAVALQYAPDADLLFSESFDNFVWGGNIMAGQESTGYAPTAETITAATGTDRDGYADSYVKVSCNNPGSAFIQSNTWDEISGKTVGTSHLMSDTYVASRNIGDYTYMFRCQEYQGFLACGAGNTGRGIFQTAALKAIDGIRSVKVSFDFCYQYGSTDLLLFQVVNGGMIASASVDDKEIPLTAENSGYLSAAGKYIVEKKHVTLPSGESAAKKWHRVEVVVNNATDGTMLYWGGNDTGSGVHGFYLDNIEVRSLGEMARGADNLRVLYWNIQNGMWSDQGNNYSNFVAWVKKYDPDVCIWCESASIYKNNTNSGAPESERFLPAGWPALAARYGHSYTAVGGHRDNYPQTVTSKYPIETLLKITDSDQAGKPISHGAGIQQITVKGRKINLVTLHTWPQAYAYGVTGTADREASAARKEGDKYREFEIEYICAKTVNDPAYAAQQDWLMMGDFNSRSRLDNWYYGYPADDTRLLVHNHILDHTDLVDIIAERNPGCFVSSTYGNARIDYIYASPSMYARIVNALIVVDKWTSATKSPYVSNFYDPSDHRPILVDFELK